MVESAVELLEDLAGGGRVLEFAVGTGRIAAPLAARGLWVSGIELSRAMAARIADKPGGEAIDVTIGDMTTTRVPGEFLLVYLVFNTISNVTSQDASANLLPHRPGVLEPGAQVAEGPRRQLDGLEVKLPGDGRQSAEGGHVGPRFMKLKED